MKTFLLGLGAQKGGTSWLHRQLQDNANVDMGFIKEYHVLDALTLPHFKGMILRRLRELPPVPEEADHGAVLRHLRRREFLWLSLYTRPSAYYDYFASLLRPEGIAMTGDITPSYSALGIETLQTVRAEFAARGIAVKCVFLMRDPVERLWSAIRMQRRLIRERNPDRKFARSEGEAMLEAMDSPDARMRGNYHETLRRIEAVFDPADRFIGLYETFLSDPAQWQAFARVCGVPLKAPDYGRRVNVSAKSEPLDEEIMRRVAEAYRPAYEAVRKTLPALDIDRHWASARFV